MFYSYHTNAGTFVLERQQFTESAWQFVFNGRFVDSYPCPFQAARRIGRLASRLRIKDAVLLPPGALAGWEVRWSKDYDGDAPELWLHRIYTEGRKRQPEQWHTSHATAAAGEPVARYKPSAALVAARV
jgi:hypothetical protein